MVTTPPRDQPFAKVTGCQLVAVNVGGASGRIAREDERGARLGEARAEVRLGHLARVLIDHGRRLVVLRRRGESMPSSEFVSKIGEETW